MTIGEQRLNVLTLDNDEFKAVQTELEELFEELDAIMPEGEENQSFPTLRVLLDLFSPLMEATEEGTISPPATKEAE